MKTIVTRAVCLTFVSAAVSAWAFSGDAYADKQGAPIRYATPASPQTSPQTPQPQTGLAATQAGQASVNAERRVEFLYPGETPLVSTPQTSNSVNQPVSRSPGKLVLQAQPDVTFAATPRDRVAPAAVQASPLAQSNPPELSGGTAPSQPIRIASLKVDKPASTGTPLTLSRVKVNRDAPIGEERGKAGIYTDGFDGAPTANGEIFDETAMTAAHPSLPLPSLVQVINEDNRREIVVRVNDRGPFDGKRILELSPRAGTVLGMSKGGSANVRLRYLGPAPVKQNPIADTLEPVANQSFASTSVVDESLPPVSAPTRIVRQPVPLTPVADYGEPSLGVPDPVEPMRASTPSVSGNVYIQAGAFADIANAQSLTRALGRGQSVRIEEARVNGSDYFRVLIGPFATTQSAEVQRSQLSRAGIVDGFLTTR
ncbi:MAG: septal ring lytic transglycosylase RlpA family protein [Hyphomonadaceae bacterium]|nr:septal ring lytic transglycosylase RlpA family protein [Hyphomonadaceae bacterium]